ncbi:MAG: GNAT family N-acetyltransferase [Methyloversatilis sp.]|jgi:ribosomal protein S18 acetylase RimI-like enzyme|nr:GNAT family N-acetyltransferase [Methyloversatilis sp.]
MCPDGVEHPTSSAWRNEAWAAHDGRVLVLRPMASTDMDTARAFIRNLSFGSRYFRFGRGDIDFDDDALRSVCAADALTNTHLVVVTNDDPSNVVIAASARYVVQDDGESCVFGLVVADAWQGEGLGRRLMQALIDSARGRGLKVMRGEVLASNARMLGFLQKMGFDMEETAERWPSVRKLSLRLEPGNDA